MDSEETSLYQFGQFQFEAETQRLLCAGELIPLPQKAAAMLHLFLQQPGRVCKKEVLIESLWPGETVEDANLSQTVYLLRKALSQADASRQFIETIPKIGYRFLPSVSVAQLEPTATEALALAKLPAEESWDTPAVAEIAPEHSMAARSTPPQTVVINEYGQGASLRETVLSFVFRRTQVSRPVAREQVAGQQLELANPMWRRGWVKPASATLCLATIAILTFLFRPGSEQIHSLAVLPFTELGGAGQEETLGLGLADALITRLSNLNTLAVRPTNAVESYVNRQTEALEIGRKLGVEALLDGRYQRLGGQLRLTVQLIRVRDGKPLWADSFEEQADDLLTVQKMISERLAHALTLKLTAEQRQHLKKEYTANAAAFQAYMKGRFFLAKRIPESIRLALGYFEKAIELDPTYALAYTGIADCYVALGTPQIMMGAQPQAEAFAKVRAAARKALELDATLAEAHASLGVGLLIEDDAAGHRELEHALSLNPNYVQAYNYYGTHLLGDGLPAEALEKFKRALELDPLSILSHTNLGMALFRLRRYEEAVRQFKKTLEMDENYLRAHWGLGLTYEQLGRYDNARSEFQRLETLSNGGPLAVTALGHLDALAGRRAEAEQRLTKLLEMQRQGIVSGYYVAAIYAGLGDYEQAFAWLARSRLPAASGLHKIDAYFDPLRNDPRFLNLFQSNSGQ